MILARGGNMLGVKPGTYVTSCSDGFRPVFYLIGAYRQLTIEQRPIVNAFDRARRLGWVSAVPGTLFEPRKQPSCHQSGQGSKGTPPELPK
jgi:hypothetical protein